VNGRCLATKRFSSSSAPIFRKITKPFLSHNTLQEALLSSETCNVLRDKMVCVRLREKEPECGRVEVGHSAKERTSKAAFLRFRAGLLIL
jgi:hypothetical protein